MFFRLLSILVAGVSLGLIFRVGPLGQMDYQSLAFMHLPVIIAFYASFSFFKKDVKLISTNYDLRRTMEGFAKKTGSSFTQFFVVLFVAIIWLLPLLLAALWWAAGQLAIDFRTVGIPFLWSVLSLSAFIYLCLLNPILRKKYK